MSDTHPTPAHPVLDLVTRADRAICNEDFSSLLTFYAEDAALVLTDSLTVRGRHAIAEAFVAVARHFNHSLQVTQGPMKVIEGAGTALVLAQTQLRYLDSQGQVQRETREATYVFRFDTTDGWLCVVDNSYGTALLHPSSPLAIIRPQLHGLCGKIASGKSTLAVQLAHQQQAILLEDDRWLTTLYPGQINTLPDYVRCAALLKEVLRPLVLALLGAGINVVLDIPGNTRQQRAWLSALAEQAEAEFILHVLETEDEVCKARLRQRNAEASHAFQTSEAMFDRISAYFEPPETDNLTCLVIRHRPD